MRTTRRTALKTLLAAGVAAGALPLGACDEVPASATAPWTGPAAGETDPRRRALSWALLAPNPHNRQPWLADLRQPGLVRLHVETGRTLPQTDPYGRQILIGCGAFLELLVMAAAADGWRTEVQLFPDGTPAPDRLDERPFATVAFAAAPATVDPLFAAVRTRRSVKEPFQPDSAPDAATLAALGRAAGGGFGATASPDRVAALKTLILDAWKIEYDTPRTLKESVDLMRIGSAEIAANPDGIDLAGPMIWVGRTLGLVTREKLLTPGTMAHGSGLSMYADMFAATPAFGWLTSADNERATQIAAGRAYLRLALAATTAGLAVHPVSQALQEFPEMAPAFERAHRLLEAPPSGRVQMLFRLGRHDGAVPPAPRRPLPHMVIT